MKRICVAMFLPVVLFVAVAISQDQKPKITIRQIAEADIIGDLGVPIGTCVDIQGKIIKDNSNTKDRGGRLFLEVAEVEGRKLPTPVVFDFRSHQFATKNVKVASDHFELYELRTGKKTGSLSGEQIKQLEKGYVDSIVKLTVFETLGFRGIPNNLPKGVLIWQDVRYSLATTLIVMDQK
jgi:hypothetical protein